MRWLRTLSIPILLLACFDGGNAHAKDTAQCGGDAGPASQISALEQVLMANYIFPAKVPTIMGQLRKQIASGRYSAASDTEFAEFLSQYLVSTTNDLHFMVGVEAQEQSKDGGSDELADPNTNYQFQNVSMLPGKIGYLRFDNFSQPDAAFRTVTAAMTFLENADALIIDLRYNNGGYNDLGQLISSYLFSGEKDRMLTSYYYNEDGKRIERGQWVLSGVPGRRRPDMPVHILTSTVTFSAAEWMAYSLQQLDRATIIGAQTAGGAHPVERFQLCGDFFVQVPIGEARGPNGGEFEGIGVTPDIAVPSYDALKTSHLMLLETLNKQSPDKEREWAIVAAKAKVDNTDVSDKWLKALAGQYSDRELIYEGSILTYRWRDRFQLGLIPLNDRLFAVEGTDDYRIEILGKDNIVTGIARVFPDGTRQIFERTK